MCTDPIATMIFLDLSQSCLPSDWLGGGNEFVLHAKSQSAVVGLIWFALVCICLSPICQNSRVGGRSAKEGMSLHLALIWQRKRWVRCVQHFMLLCCDVIGLIFFWRTAFMHLGVSLWVSCRVLIISQKAVQISFLLFASLSLLSVL